MNPIWSDFFKRKSTPESQALTILSRSAMFEGVAMSDLKKILKIIHVREYKKDEVVFKTGDPGVGMYIVQQGRVGVYVQDEDSGKEELITQLYEGESFGDFALFSDSARSATIKAMVQTHLLGFCKPDLMSFITRNPLLGSKILIQILGLAGRRLEETNRQLSLNRRELKSLRKDYDELKKKLTGVDLN